MAKRRKYRRLKIFIAMIVIFIATVVITMNLISNKKSKTKNSTSANSDVIDGISEEAKIPDDRTINMTVIGDIMCHNTQYNDAYVNGVYDFSYVFLDVEEKLSTADITVRES